MGDTHASALVPSMMMGPDVREGRVDIRLLGPVAVHGPAGPLELGPRRQRFVLAVLALEANHPVPVDRLVELAWSVDAPRTAEHAVEVCVSRLRGALRAGGVLCADAELVREGRAYRLRTGPDAVDVHRFQAKLRDAAAATDDARRVAVLTEALDLWTGPPLAGAAPPEVVERLCRGLSDARWTAVEERVDARLRLGQHGQVLGELADLTGANPGRERLVAQYATALYRCGRAADALAVCRSHRDWLAQELGLDPGAPLQRLEVSILRNDASLTAPPPAAPIRPTPRELPGDIASFVGRREELDRLDAAMSRTAERAVVIVALSGTAGVGKTTLALHWAHRVADQFPDGQLYVNLRGFGGATVLNAALALRQLIAALGVPAGQIPAGLDARASLFRSLLSGKRVLVVLDNARDADHVRPLLPGSVGSMAVVTSRTSLVGLVAAGACQVALDVLSPAEAREFLAARIGSDAVATQPDQIDEIIARCARLPLALAIASARMHAGPARLAAELAASDGSLEAFHLPETTVETIISWSYQVLSGRAARLFRLVGCNPGPDLTETAAASLAGLEPAEARRCLRELVDANLLAEHLPGRYACHDLLRAYAADRARAEDSEADRRAAVERLVEHYVHSGYAADRLVYPARPPIELPEPPAGVVVPRLADATAGWAWLIADHATLLAALDVAAAGWPLSAWRLAWATSTLHQRRGHPQDLYRTWRAALEALKDIDAISLRVTALREMGEACARMDRFPEAFDHLHEAARLADSQDERATVLRTLARTYSRSGDDRAAFERASRSLAIYRRLGRLDLVPSAANAVGWYAARIGEHDTAASHLRLALATAREQGDQLVESHTLHSQGYLAQRMDRHHEAIALLRQCVRMARSNGDTHNEATSLRDLGHSYAALGQSHRATQHWRRALPLLESQARWSEADELRAYSNGPGPED
jgi:DNA-binding SARP family transcriptional activator/tetratricopeptide (TPR) repeat protein